MKILVNGIWICWLCLVVMMPSFTFAEDPARDPFYTQGVQKDAPPINTVDEHIDPFSGILTLNHTDIHLPGNGGLDLNIVRTYNSMIWGRRDVSNPGLVASNEKSTMGIGWTMHMGIVKNPAGTGSSNRFLPNNPVFELPDGSKQIFYRDKNDSTRLISKDFWIYKNVGTWIYEVTSPSGIVYTVEYNDNAGYNIYEGTTLVNIAQVTRIRNAAATAQITVTYAKGLYYLSRITTITDSLNRTVSFSYNSDNLLSSITANNRTYSYTYTTIDNYKYLTTATQPVGNSWTYAYETATNTYELNAINFPTGGRIGYSYSNVYFNTGGAANLGVTPVSFRVVTGRTTSGRGITGGTWTYGYSATTAGSPNVTTISAPGVTETHTYYGWGNTGTNNVWKVGLPMSKSYSGALTLTESYNWTQGTLISYDEISNAGWTGTLGFVYDVDIYVPFLSSKSITRDGKTYSTTYGSYDTYGNPQSIAETGDISRSSTVAYWTSTTKNIVKGKPSTETITGGFSGTSSATWTYDSTSGNVTQSTNNGVTTGYGYDANGNLSSRTDANNRQITYLWSNGKISRAANPIYAVSRVINSNGTIASETNGRGYTTTYAYDNNLRLTGISPPAGNSTSISYPADSSTKTETRGGYTITYNFDGFGRPSGSSDSRGVTTSIAYSAYGVKSSSSSNIGDTTNFDYFGRPTQVVHKDNTRLSYAYANSNVTATDENNATAAYTYSAFGNPDEKYLMSVRDQANNITTYGRNIVGLVTGITQSGISRSFTYSTKYFLSAETNPETGSISYGRDNVGNMTSKTDSSGTKSYGYDAINRLTGVTSGGSSISYGYDFADNRTSTTSPAASLSYVYDAVNRLTSKSETVAGRSYTTAYGYDNNDNLTSITYPTSSRVISYGYNSNNQVTSVSGFGGSVSSVLYNTAGLPVSFSYTNGISNTIGYNTRNLTTTINSGSAVNLAYGYDSRGNTTSLTNYLDSTKSQSYNYDSLSRLTVFNGAWGSGAIGYDVTGNRTSKTVAGVSTTYGYSSNRMTSASGGEPASYSYNGNGALTGGSWLGANYTLAYDAFDNLASYATGGTSLADFVYDGDGMRVAKTASGKTTVYHYDLGGRVLSENYSDGRFIADYVYLNGKLAAKVAAAPTISVVPTSDSFGSVYVNTSSSPHTITINNSGTADLTIGTISLNGANPAEFSKSSDTCSGQTLAPSANCSVQIIFSPTSIGSKSANLTIPSNDPVTSTYNVSVNGIGVNPALSVANAGTGSGSVSSSPSGISCGSTCSASFVAGTVVTLTATASADSVFAGWSGACSGTGSCVVTMNADSSVTATFNKLPPVAAFTASPTTGGDPLYISFTDQSQWATSWLWDFGDGTTSTAQSPSHMYRAPGSYTVSLTASNVSGSSTATRTDYIAVSNCGNQPVRIVGGSSFNTIQAAYDAAAEGDVIQAQAREFVESLSAGSSKYVTIDGGYTCDYSSNPGVTDISGAPHISAGTVRMKNIHIKQ